MSMSEELIKSDDASENSPESLWRVMRPFLINALEIEGQQELLWIIGLDNSNEIITIELVSRSSVNKEPVEPPDVFRVCVLREVIKVVLVSYNPDIKQLPKDFTPSDQYNKMTANMSMAGKLLRIRVMEHLFITEDEYFSYRCTGLLEKLIDKGN
jgi:DNA repair protein RadC